MTLAERLAALPPMAVADRLPRLRDRLEGAGAEALLVTSLTNIRYLTGFTGSAALVVVTPDDLVFVTDGRYGEQATHQLAEAGVEAAIEVASTAQRDVVAAATTGYGRIGLEAEHVTWAAQRRYEAEWFPDAELVPTSGLVEGLRRIKDEGELARLEVAAAVADAALAELRPRLLDGPTEREFGRELDATMRRLGASGPSFETIVASGPNGSRPHARPSDRRIAPGDLVVLDFGSVVDGYCSDMTPTVAIDDVQRRMLEVVTAAQAAGVAAVRPGVAAVDVDRACRDVIAEAGWADSFTHGTGHGVGLDIHEAPRVGTTSDATLAAGDVVTVEPGVYLPGHGGVRVEDTVVVTPGGARPLNHTTKDPAP